MEVGSKMYSLGRVGLKVCGEYSASQRYNELDVVTYKDSSYVAKEENINIPPTNSQYWMVLAQALDLKVNSVEAKHIKAGAVEADKITANAVTAEKIQAGSVEADKIAAGAVTAEKIQAGSVEADKIAAGAVTAEKIGAGAVEADKIFAGAITADKIAANAVTSEKISAGAVDAEKIAAGSVTADRLDANSVDAKIASIALANLTTANIETANINWADIEQLAADIAAISKAHLADADILWADIERLNAAMANIAQAEIQQASIDGAHITDATITNAKIANGTIETAKIALGAITTALIASGAIGTAQIADGSITSAKIVELNADLITAGTLSVERLLLKGPNGLFHAINATDSGLTMEDLSEEQYQNAISGTVLVARSVSADKIAAQSITANELASGAITTEKLAAEAVDASKIKAGSVTTSHVTADFGDKLDLSSNEGITQRVQSAMDYTDQAALSLGDQIADGNEELAGQLEALNQNINGAIAQNEAAEAQIANLRQNMETLQTQTQEGFKWTARLETIENAQNTMGQELNRIVGDIEQNMTFTANEGLVIGKKGSSTSVAIDESSLDVRVQGAVSATFGANRLRTGEVDTDGILIGQMKVYERPDGVVIFGKVN